jgi:hypothetical protein
MLIKPSPSNGSGTYSWEGGSILIDQGHLKRRLGFMVLYPSFREEVDQSTEPDRFAIRCNPL